MPPLRVSARAADSGGGARSAAAAMANAAFILGPQFQLVDTLAVEDAALRERGGPAGALATAEAPLLLKGVAEDWPLFERWSFSKLARLKGCVRARAARSCCRAAGPLCAAQTRPRAAPPRAAGRSPRAARSRASV